MHSLCTSWSGHPEQCVENMFQNNMPANVRISTVRFRHQSKASGACSAACQATSNENKTVYISVGYINVWLWLEPCTDHSRKPCTCRRYLTQFQIVQFVVDIAACVYASRSVRVYSRIRAVARLPCDVSQCVRRRARINTCADTLSFLVA